MAPRRGEVHWIDWYPRRGSEQAGRRPGLVISGDTFNQQFHVCTTVALTTQIRPSRIAVDLPARFTGTQSQILPWQIMTIAESRLDGYICTLPRDVMEKVEAALRLVWHL